MKLKLRIARWIARRIEKRSRLERRALRDYRRREGCRIRRDEKRSRGLRLYIGWSQPLPGSQRFHAVVLPKPSAFETVRGIIPAGVNAPRAAH